MREVLFKAKRLDNGEWVEGNLITGKWYIDEREIVAITPLDNAFYPHCEMSEWYEVDPNTVGQYTGLCDKNGKKIFEGDIVLVEGRTGTVVYSEENCVWYVGIEYGFEPPLNDYDRLYIKVIGNVHDNPELLEGGENVCIGG